MRTISRFEAGAIPAKPQVFQFYDEDGNPANLNAYTEWNVEMIGSNDEKVDLSGIDIRTGNTGIGQITVIWPRNNRVFANTGEYVLRFRFSGYGAVDFSESHTIRVTEFGRVK